MALSTVPFALQNAAHSADLFREAVSSLIPNTAGLVQPGDLAVSQTGSPSMAVQIGVGRVWVKGTEAGDLAGQTYGKQGLYYALNDAAVTKTITTANATNPRIDVAYIAVKDQQYSGTVNNVDFYIAAGTPAASPVAPTLPANALALANIAVAANATSITNANITNVATSYKFQHVEFVRLNQNDEPASTLWGLGAMYPSLVDANASRNYADWCAAGASDAVKLSPGTYLIDWKILNLAGGAVNFWHSICTDGSSASQANGTSIGRSQNAAVAGADPYYTFGHIIIPSTPTDVYFKFSCGTANSPMHHRIKITKVQ